MSLAEAQAILDRAARRLLDEKLATEATAAPEVMTGDASRRGEYFTLVMSERQALWLFGVLRASAYTDQFLGRHWHPEGVEVYQCLGNLAEPRGQA